MSKYFIFSPDRGLSSLPGHQQFLPRLTWCPRPQYPHSMSGGASCCRSHQHIEKWGHLLASRLPEVGKRVLRSRWLSLDCRVSRWHSCEDHSTKRRWDLLCEQAPQTLDKCPCSLWTRSLDLLLECQLSRTLPRFTCAETEFPLGKFWGQWKSTLSWGCASRRLSVSPQRLADDSISRLFIVTV